METAVTGVAAGATDLQSSLNALALAFRPFTIVRTRGLILVESDQIAANEQPFGAFGMCVVTDQAVAIGVTAVPSPWTDQASDVWLMHQFWAAPWKFNTSGAASQAMFQFDSKAMRKVEDGEDVITVFENGNTSHGVRYIAMLRFLIKMS